MSVFHNHYSHAKVVSVSGGKSLTDQQYRDECSVDKILRRYNATGQPPVSIRPSGVSGDFSGVGDFQTCLERINRAKDEFESLPSELRARFGHDPAAYVDFVLDPANEAECIKLGFRVSPPPAPPSETPLDVLKRIEKVVTPKGGSAA